MNLMNIRVAILYNEDSHISRGNPQDLVADQYTITAARNLYDALSGLGYPVRKIVVRESLEELEDTLRSLSPDDTFIFNNCDGFDGNSRAAVEVIGIIERMGFKHTGAAAETIEGCVNKGRMKERLIQWNVPTPRYQVFSKAGGTCTLKYPVIVKPLLEDASMGIDLSSVISTSEDLFDRVSYIVGEYEQPALAEEFIGGRELAVALWGNEEVEILPISEVDFSYIANPLERLLTYEAKWFPDSRAYRNTPTSVPASLVGEEEQVIRKAALDSFRAMGLKDLGRVDIRLESGIPYVIDINELPDLSLEGGFWFSVRAAGIEYPHMVEYILKLALKREGWIE